MRLTTVLDLVEGPPARNGKKQTYLIQSQNDLYQVDEFIKFPSMLGLLRLLVLAWQFIATAFCVLGSWLFWWVSWGEENVVGGNWEKSLLSQKGNQKVY